jgi:transcriptional regulator with XRE-family HTH domain
MPALPLAKPEQAKPVLLPVAQELLRDALRARGKTVTALASELGVSRKHLSNVLNGHAPIAMPLMQGVCDALGIEPELVVCLLDHGSEPRPDPYGFMPGWIVAHDDLTLPMEDWEMLED